MNYYYESDAQKYFIGDPNRIQLVLHNIIRNAIQFTEKGSISIEIVERSLPEDLIGDISIYIRDTGIGIPSDKLQDVFNRFSRLEESHLKNFGGSGIGLFTSKTLIGMMGGKLEVESKVGEGSQFTIHLHLKKGVPVSEFPAPTVVGRHIGCPYVKEYYPIKSSYFFNPESADEKTKVLSLPILKTGSSSYTMEKKHDVGVSHIETLLFSLLKGCPWGDERKSCPLSDLRKLPLNQGRLEIQKMSRNEKIKICEAHQICVASRH